MIKLILAFLAELFATIAYELVQNLEYCFDPFAVASYIKIPGGTFHVEWCAETGFSFSHQQGTVF